MPLPSWGCPSCRFIDDNVVLLKDQTLVPLIFFLFSCSLSLFFFLFLCFLGVYIYSSSSAFVWWKLKLFILDPSYFLLSFNITHFLLITAFAPFNKFYCVVFYFYYVQDIFNFLLRSFAGLMHYLESCSLISKYLETFPLSFTALQFNSIMAGKHVLCSFYSVIFIFTKHRSSCKCCIFVE